MKIQLKVRKTDGSEEDYLHTKVIGAINNTLVCMGESDIFTAEQLAEAVTYFFYHEQKKRSITSSEIFSVIKAVLTATNYADAALAFEECYFERKLKRLRVEVVSFDHSEATDAETFDRIQQAGHRSQWDKSRIINTLINTHSLDRQTARAVASMVEEKIFNMGVTQVSTSLIKHLILSDTASVLRAQRQLQTI